jgi:hypothetical protein
MHSVITDFHQTVQHIGPPKTVVPSRELFSRAPESSSGHAVWPAVRSGQTTSARGSNPRFKSHLHHNAAMSDNTHLHADTLIAYSQGFRSFALILFTG